MFGFSRLIPRASHADPAGRSASVHRPTLPAERETVPGSPKSPLSYSAPRADLKGKLATAALSFRGYNVTNLGKSPELLAHPVYGPIVAATLEESGAICSDTIQQKVDLVTRVRERRPSDLESFADDVAMIVGMEVAQLRLLKEVFDVDPHQCQMMFGYSIGELSALVCAEVFPLDQILPVPLALATDCAALAVDVTMGIVFTKTGEIPIEVIQRCCAQTSGEGKGLIGMSAHLGPNAVLVLGQGDTLARFERRLKTESPVKIAVRRHGGQWPPLHTPIVWQRNISNRAAMHLHQITGGNTKPKPTVYSLVTGKASYNDFNSRQILVDWVDHPQLLWQVIYETFVTGVQTVIHVGPEPNLAPATYDRLAHNVRDTIGQAMLGAFGRRVISNVTRRWLTNLLPSNAPLLRAPFIEHIILEDWLLAQKVD